MRANGVCGCQAPVLCLRFYPKHKHVLRFNKNHDCRHNRMSDTRGRLVTVAAVATTDGQQKNPMCCTLLLFIILLSLLLFLFIIYCWWSLSYPLGIISFRYPRARPYRRRTRWRQAEKNEMPSLLNSVLVLYIASTVYVTNLHMPFFFFGPIDERHAHLLHRCRRSVYGTVVVNRRRSPRRRAVRASTSF